MPELHEVPRGERGASEVVGRHPGPVGLVPDQDGGDPAFAQDGQAGVLVADVHDQDGAREALGLGEMVVLGDLAQGEAERAGLAFERPSEQHVVRREERIAGGGRQAEGPSGPPREVTGGRVGLVAEAVHDVEDAFARDGRDGVVAVDDAAHRSLRHSRRGGDVLDGGFHDSSAFWVGGTAGKAAVEPVTDRRRTPFRASRLRSCNRLHRFNTWPPGLSRARHTKPDPRWGAESGSRSASGECP